MMGRTIPSWTIICLLAASAAASEHWSFVPPRRSPLPVVQRKGWAQNPIDRFVLARLEQAGQSPSPQADRAKLIRRVTLDLTGLPPTPEQVQALTTNLQAISYRMQELMDARESPQARFLVGELLTDVRA